MLVRRCATDRGSTHRSARAHVCQEESCHTSEWRTHHRCYSGLHHGFVPPFSTRSLLRPATIYPNMFISCRWELKDRPSAAYHLEARTIMDRQADLQCPHAPQQAIKDASQPRGEVQNAGRTSQRGSLPARHVAERRVSRHPEQRDHVRSFR